LQEIEGQSLANTRSWSGNIKMQTTSGDSETTVHKNQLYVFLFYPKHIGVAIELQNDFLSGLDILMPLFDYLIFLIKTSIVKMQMNFPVQKMHKIKKVT
jgi:hypothetical protein